MVSQYSHKDLDQCCHLFLDVFCNEPWNYSWLLEANVRRYLTDLENTPCSLGLIFREEGELYGFCLGVTSDYFLEKTYDIKEILVSRQRQGKGIGSLILQESEAYLRQVGVNAITLSTDVDIDAFSFYLKNGYVSSKKAVFMSKIL